MALPAIPSDVLQYIQDAAKGTGLPQNVVAAQNYVESAYGSNEGPSSTGAEGPWQFEPYTWPSYSSLPFSDATNWSDSTDAYIKFMSSLLKEENGSVRDALAAYNAGPGNVSAGYAYADEILSLAGSSTSLSIAPSSSGGSSDTSSSLLGGLIQIPTQITGFFGDADKFVSALMWLVQPSSWLRIGAFLVGLVLLLLAGYAFVAVSEGRPIMPNIQPTPVPIPV